MPRTPTRNQTRLLRALLVVATIAFPFGLVLPILRIERPLSDVEYGVLTGIWTMLTGGLPVLAVVVLAFSVAFPAAKLTLLWRSSLSPSGETRATSELLRALGKWSMLDVYVVVILMGAVRLGVLAGVEARSGLYVFGASVLLAMTVAMLSRHLRDRSVDVGEAARKRLSSPAARALSLGSLVAFAAGVALPLMVVEKWVFWSNDYSIASSLAPMASEGRFGLLALVVVFVLVLPAARLVAFTLLRWRRAPSERLVRRVLALEEWAMADVFALAMLVVVTKASQMATVSARAGLWFLVAAAILMLGDAWLLRRELRLRVSS